MKTLAEIAPLPIARVTQASLGLLSLRFIAEPASEAARISPENLADLFPRVESVTARPAA